MSWGLRSFILAVPNQIEPMLLSCKKDLQQHLELLNDNNAPHGRMAVGVAHGLAVIVQVCPSRPLYFSTTVISEIWTLASSLLKTSGKSDLRSSHIQIQVAWTLIGALMSIGFHFVKSRLTQLMLLWQNALPRAFSKEAMAGRNISELQYLLHVKERALAALLLFLQYNERLITHDTSKRIAMMLSDTSAFVGRLPNMPLTDDMRTIALYSQLLDISVKVKTRVLRCYSLLVRYDDRNIAGPELLMTTIFVFAEAEPLISKAVSSKALVVSSLDSFASITDNYAWGVTSYLQPLTLPGIGEIKETGPTRHWSVLSSESDALETMVHSSPSIWLLMTCS